MMELGVYEPTELVRQAVLSASEVTNSILRIDDIIARRPAQ
jgi:chaperonin GroEL (HSP60 family)